MMVNQFFMILKKVGHVVIRLFILGKNFKILKDVKKDYIKILRMIMKEYLKISFISQREIKIVNNRFRQ